MKTIRQIRSLISLLTIAAGAFGCAGPAHGQPATLTQPRVQGDGSFRFEAAAPLGRKRIETSADLHSWTNLGTTNATTFAVLQPGASASPQRFFRVRCDEATAIDDLGLKVTSIRSTNVALRWQSVPGAMATRVYLAAEPCCGEVGLPAQKLVASLPGSATNFVLGELAPATHCFLRVTADTPTNSHSSLAHARTSGGPRAPLDSPVREVLGWAPNALQVVLTAHMTSAVDSGAGLQTGWHVTRASGAEIAVTAVHRHSVPIGAPAYGLGPEPSGDVNVIDADHRLFLMRPW